jgi:alkylation response protein AidB-like acyl-CoA dehydrogenase
VAYLTDERRDLQKDAYEFAMKEVLPVANSLDRKEEDIPWDLIAKMGSKRYFGITVPKEYDGLGLGIFEYCLITEELSRAWMSSASVIARAQGMGVNMLPPEKREEYLRKQVRGEFVGAFALSEAEAGSDVANISCRAERVGDEWVINGEKKWVGWAQAADFIVLFARTQEMDPTERWKGISSFLILKERGSFPSGIEASKIDKIGYFGITTWTLRFKDFHLPVQTWSEPARGVRGAAERSGAAARSAAAPRSEGSARERARPNEGMAFLGAVSGLNVARLHTAARAVGAAQGAFDEAVEYAQQRKQFGQPISHFQGIRFKIAEMATEIEAGRELWQSAAQRMDDGGAVPHQASMAKLFCSEMAERVTSEAIQVLGGEGYTRNHSVERHWRDARLTKIFEGTSEIQKRIISDALLGRAGR